MDYSLTQQICGNPTPAPANTGGCCGGGCSTGTPPAPPPVSTTIPTDTGTSYEPVAVGGTTGPTYEPD